MNYLNTLLRLNLEIDGALRTYADRRNAEALSLLNEKVESFNYTLKLMTDEFKPNVPISDLSVATQDNRDSLIETPQDEKSWESSESKELPEVIENQESLEISETVVDKIVLPETPVESETVELPAIEDNEAITEVKDEESTDQVILDEDSLIDNTVKSVDDEEAYEPKVVSPSKIEVSASVNINSERTEPLRVDEAISIREAKDLTRAFTLNDKFRFLRGLFCDDKADFDDTLKHLSELDSLDEAYDYLLNDLEWDVENEEVQAFISIIANHFNEA